MSNLYQEELLDHYQYPRDKKVIEKPDFQHKLINHSCGDEVEVMGVIQDNILKDVGFQGTGCIISQASASLLMEAIRGKSVHEVENYDRNVVLELVQLDLGPARLRCALLALEALKRGIQQYREAEKI